MKIQTGPVKTVLRYTRQLWTFWTNFCVLAPWRKGIRKLLAMWNCLSRHVLKLWEVPSKMLLLFAALFCFVFMILYGVRLMVIHLEVAELTESLRHKLSLKHDLHLIDAEVFGKSCRDYNITNYNDTGTHLRTDIPVKLQDRIKSLIAFVDDHPIPHRVWSAMGPQRAQIKWGNDVIIATAASSNHYKETLLMLQHMLLSGLFTSMKHLQFQLILYDLGLDQAERVKLMQHCGDYCKILRFPFRRLPSHFSRLRCYAWKYFIISTHLKQTDVLIYMDSSIRSTVSGLHAMIQRTIQRGVQQRLEGHLNNRNTLVSTYEYFGDSPCSHGNHIHQCEGGSGMYHNEPFVWRMFIQPILTCASDSTCMCPFPYEKYADCSTKNKDAIAVCHRQDQSALSIILARLFREHYHEFVVVMDGWQTIKRTWG